MEAVPLRRVLVPLVDRRRGTVVEIWNGRQDVYEEVGCIASDAGLLSSALLEPRDEVVAVLVLLEASERHLGS